MAADFWNQRYADEAFAYGEAPNDFFATQLKSLTAGRLLLPAEGEGRNAVYAARNGWKVTAFDMSEAGKMKCQRLAAQHRVTVDYHLADAADFDYGHEQYDAIALIFAHFPMALRWHVHQHVVHALKPGGTLILEAFSPAQVHYNSGGPKDISMLYTASTLRQDFNQLHIHYCEEVLTTLHEGVYHQGMAAVVRLVAQKPA